MMGGQGFSRFLSWYREAVRVVPTVVYSMAGTYVASHRRFSRSQLSKAIPSGSCNLYHVGHVEKAVVETRCRIVLVMLG